MPPADRRPARIPPAAWPGLVLPGLALPGALLLLGVLASPTAQAQVPPLDEAELAVLMRHIAPCRRGVEAPRDALLEMEVQVDAQARVVAVRPALGSPPPRPALRPLYEDLRDAFRDPRCNPLPLSRRGIIALNRSMLVLRGRMIRLTSVVARPPAG